MKKIKRFFLYVLTKLGFLKQPDFLSELIPEHPSKNNLPFHSVFIVGGPGYQKWAYLRCPCGCGDVILLSLLKARRPNWSIKRDFFDRPTVHPSIRQIAGCKSHFWINKGRVVWAKSVR